MSTEVKIKSEEGKIITIIAKDGKPGDKGDPGDSRTEKEVIDLLKPFIPKPIKGDSPTKKELTDIIKPLIPSPIKGNEGKTPDDKKLISLIKPLIPKPIKGDPGSPDSPKQVKDKLLKEGLKYDELQDAPDIEQIIKVYRKQSSKTVSVVELDDVDLSGVTIVNGKYVLGGGIADNAYAETPSGLVNSSNTVFTLDNIPTESLNVIVALNGVVKYNTIDYTVVNQTITFVVAPTTGVSIFAYYRGTAGTPPLHGPSYLMEDGVSYYLTESGDRYLLE